MLTSEPENQQPLHMKKISGVGGKNAQAKNVICVHKIVRIKSGSIGSVGADTDAAAVDTQVRSLKAAACTVERSRSWCRIGPSVERIFLLSIQLQQASKSLEAHHRCGMALIHVSLRFPYPPTEMCTLLHLPQLSNNIPPCILQPPWELAEV